MVSMVDCYVARSFFLLQRARRVLSETMPKSVDDRLSRNYYRMSSRSRGLLAIEAVFSQFLIV